MGKDIAQVEIQAFSSLGMALDRADIGLGVGHDLLALNGVGSPISILVTPVGLFDVKVPVPDGEVCGHKILIHLFVQILLLDGKGKPGH
jgi:hypothetical protein